MITLILLVINKLFNFVKDLILFLFKFIKWIITSNETNFSFYMVNNLYWIYI